MARSLISNDEVYAINISSKSRTDYNKSNPSILKVAEFFCDTLQGEGINIGVPSTFLRLAGCTLNCKWCDSVSVWKHGAYFTIIDLLQLMDSTDNLINSLINGQHLVLTGGSPLLQQDALILFIQEFIKCFGFKPYIEIENECMISPSNQLLEYVDCWNNSPKLVNSGYSHSVINERLLKLLSKLPNSWFKFVVDSFEDWYEIQTLFIDSGLIHKSQVILMPQGCSRQEIAINQNKVAEMSIIAGVRYSSRLHIDLWDKKTGI